LRCGETQQVSSSSTIASRLPKKEEGKGNNVTYTTGCVGGMFLKTVASVVS
jgi:hypothetical protein